MRENRSKSRTRGMKQRSAGSLTHAFCPCHCQGLRVPCHCQLHQTLVPLVDSPAVTPSPFHPRDPLLPHENKPLQDFAPICSKRKVVMTVHDSSWVVTSPAAPTRAGEGAPHPPARRGPVWHRSLTPWWLSEASDAHQEGYSLPNSKAEKTGMLKALFAPQLDAHW